MNIVALRLYDYEHSQVLAGGMERWIRDVALLARDKGYDTTIYQKDVVSFEKELTDGIRVVGVRCGPTWRSHWTFSRWLEKNINFGDPFIYVSMELALSRRIQRAAGIQHGIFWEGDFPYYKKWLNRRLQYQLIKRLRGIICVDTNYINWCHAEYPDRASWQHKLVYVPNYADPEMFRVMPEPPRTGGLPTILFPRRVAGSRNPGRYGVLDRDSRGAGFLLKAVELLEKEGTRVRVMFAGRGRLQEEIRGWAQERGMNDRVTVTDVALDEMPRLYAQANVAVVPSLEREGTSLSAIEAIMCGIPTVVSHIGGLGNIVIDGLNGFVCDLTPESLAHGIRRALKISRLPTGPALESFRESLGKPRWERQVWGHLSHWLELG
jgi:glycosyltransferase involved in cell wall biosynthesis